VLYLLSSFLLSPPFFFCFLLSCARRCFLRRKPVKPFRVGNAFFLRETSGPDFILFFCCGDAPPFLPRSHAIVSPRQVCWQDFPQRARDAFGGAAFDLVHSHVFFVPWTASSLRIFFSLSRFPRRAGPPIHSSQGIVPFFPGGNPPHRLSRRPFSPPHKHFLTSFKGASAHSPGHPCGHYHRIRALSVF